MKTEAFRSLGASLHLPTFPECGAADSSSDTYLECVVRMAAITMYHPVGTNAMGQHPAHSVLDSKLRSSFACISLHLHIELVPHSSLSTNLLDHPFGFIGKLYREESLK